MKKKQYSTAPMWPTVILIYFSIVGIASGERSSGLNVRYKYNNEKTLLVASAVLLMSGTTLAFYENCVVKRVLCIPIKTVPWEKVTGAVYFPANNGKKKGIPQAYILLTLSPYQPKPFTETERKMFLKYNRQFAM